MNLYSNQFEFTQQPDSSLTLNDLMNMPYHKFETFVELLNKRNDEIAKEQKKTKEQQTNNQNVKTPNYKMPKFNVPKLR